MIIYDNPAKKIALPSGPQPGMYEALRANGILVEGGNSGEYASDPIAAQSFINAWTSAQSLAYSQSLVMANIDAYAKTLRDAVVSGVSTAEQASWTIKKLEADGKAGGGATPFLSAEASARGITLANLITKVQNKVAAYMNREASIAGIAGKHKDAVNNLVDAPSVMAYNYSVGWP